MNIRFNACSLMLLLACGSAAEAATFCVTSGNQLNIALNAATMNGENDEIRVTVGVHITDYHAPQAYQWEARIANEDDLDKAFNISGGWSTGNNCASQVSQNPSDTVLDARTWGPVLYFDPTNSIPGWTFSGSLSLRNLTFHRGKSFFPNQPTGILINAALAPPGSLVIDNVHVVNGQSSQAYAQAVGLSVGGSGSVKFRNNIVSNNTFTGPTSWPVGIFPYGNVYGMVTNNSIYGNSVTHTVAGLIVINTATLTNNAVADNVSTANPNYEFYSDNPTNLTLENNHFGTKAFANGTPDSETNTTTGNPAWTLVGVRTVPDAVSPLRDSGDNTPLGEVPNIDFSGHPRIVNVTIDRGAVEADAPPAAEVGPLVTPVSPANGSTTVFQGPIGGGFVGTQLTFNVSGGVAPGVTELECSVTSGAPAFGIGSPGETVGVGGSITPIDVGFDNITSEPQTGSVTCAVIRELAGTSYLTYNFVAVPPGGPAIFDSSPKKSPNPASNIDLTDPYGAVVGTDLLGETLTLLNAAYYGDSDMQVFCGLSGGSDPQITASPLEFNGDLISPQGALEVTFDCDTSKVGSYTANYSCTYDLDDSQNPAATDGTAQYQVECDVRNPPKTDVETTPPSGTTTTREVSRSGSSNFDFIFAEVSPDPDPPADAFLNNCFIDGTDQGRFSIDSPTFPGGPYAIVNGAPQTVQVTGTDDGSKDLYTANLNCEYSDSENESASAIFPMVLVVRGDARFRVTKQFTDGENPTEVAVTITCDTGLPLKQTQTISEDRNVVFVVESFDRGELDCSITEDTSAPGLAGYTPTYTADGPGNPDNVDGCNFHAIDNGSEFTCDIVNDADPVPVEIKKDWIIDGSGGDQVNQHFELTLYCDAEIVGGEIKKNSQSGCGGYPGLTAGNHGIVQFQSCLELEGNGDSTFTPEVIPEWPSSHCWVDERVYDNAVEVDNDCHNISVSHGEGDSCLITNTVFFEGIPTLGQYGMALLALLMLGVGLAGFRRFV